MRTRTEPSFIERQRRDQIIDAAVQVLAAHGRSGLTFLRIADTAGISPGLITYHFRTKTELIAAITQTLSTRLDQAMTPTGEPVGHLEALFAMVTGYGRHCADHPDEMLALGQLESAAGPQGPVHRENDIAELQQMIIDGQAAGDYRGGDPRTLTVAVLAVMASVPRELTTRPADTIDAFVDELARTVVHVVADLDRPSIRRRVARWGGRDASQRNR